MPDKDEVPPEYQKGFNDGYILAEYQPDLAKLIAKATGKSLHLDGFRNGFEQYNFEKDKTRLPDWLKSDRLSSLDKEDNKDKDDKDRT